MRIPFSRCPRAWLAALALLASAAPIFATGDPPASTGAHPQDGPDADVRVRVESERVVFAIILNLAFVDEILDIPREDEGALHPVEYEAYRLALYDYFLEVNTVEIDGVQVEPVEAGFDAEDPDPKLLPLFPAFGARALLKMRIVLDYPAPGGEMPKKVRMVWGSFPPDLALVDPEGNAPPVMVAAQLLAEGAEDIVEFYEHEPEYTWHASPDGGASRFASVPEPPAAGSSGIPLVSLGVVGVFLACAAFLLRGGSTTGARWGLLVLAPLSLGLAYGTRGVAVWELGGAASRLPDEDEARAIFEPLLANIYTAFDFGSESEIYDALARSVDGELLDALYNQVYQGLIMQEEGGAVSRVQDVNPVEIEVESIGLLPPDDVPSFQLVARWQVAGAVFHWGHAHHRTNEYRARYTVRESEGGWRIADHQILEQLRVDAIPFLPGPGPGQGDGQGG